MGGTLGVLYGSARAATRAVSRTTDGRRVAGLGVYSVIARLESMRMRSRRAMGMLSRRAIISTEGRRAAGLGFRSVRARRRQLVPLQAL